MAIWIFSCSMFSETAFFMVFNICMFVNGREGVVGIIRWFILLYYNREARPNLSKHPISSFWREWNLLGVIERVRTTVGRFDSEEHGDVRFGQSFGII